MNQPQQFPHKLQKVTDIQSTD